MISTFNPWDLRRRTLALVTKENAVDVVNVVDSYVSLPTEAMSHRRYVAAHGVSLLVASSAAVSMMLLMG